jgi:HPt (histidine-containing phosphotransfer) domain-containing protein
MMANDRIIFQRGPTPFAAASALSAPTTIASIQMVRSTTHQILSAPLPWLLGGCGLLLVAGVFGVVRWRRRQRRKIRTGEQSTPRPGKATNSDSSITIAKPFLTSPPSPADTELDLQLLRYLSDGKAESLALQIQHYLAAFDSDRRLAHSIFAGGDRKQIHHIAHRLLAHAGAVKCEPLIELAATLQAEAAILDRKKLDELLQEFDREFADLRNKLESIRASTEAG